MGERDKGLRVGAALHVLVVDDYRDAAGLLEATLAGVGA